MNKLTDKFWKSALLIRKSEQTLLELYQDGYINGTIHTCIGQEMVGVCLGNSWQYGDYVFSNHRGHGHFLGIHNNLPGFFGELLGKKAGVCGGHGGSQHFCYNGFFSNGILGSTAPISAGLAMAAKRLTKDNVSFLIIGDGALGEGAIYEALNLAAVLSLPLYVICERNGIAQSTPTDNMIGGSIEQRAKGFGFEFVHSNTNDVESHFDVMTKAIIQARTNRKPVFHLVDTQRLMAHSKSDDTRTAEYINELWTKDPLTNWLNELGCDEREKLEQELKSQIDEAVNSVIDSTPAEPLVPFEQIVKSHHSRTTPVSYSNQRFVKVLNECFKEILYKTEESLFFGEDVESPYGGAFKVSEDLSLRYPKQVFNTPISEGGITGLGIGLSMAGFRPIVEIMFGDFLTLTFDQLVNSASKFSQLFNGQVALPLLVRAPMGGRRGYGATHSQSIEKHFLGCPGLNVNALHYRLSKEELVQGVSAIDSPTILIENKLDYARVSEPLKGFELLVSSHVWPTLLCSPLCKPVLTVFCYGGMLAEVEQAVSELLYESEVAVEIVCPTQLYPLELDTLKSSVKKTGRILCIEEGTGFSSLSSEVLSQLALIEQYEIRSMFADANIVSAARNVEQHQLPNKISIKALISEWLM